MQVSELGLGTVKLGRTAGVKYPLAFELPGDAQAADLLAVARDLGINLIDTAPAYGTSEERLGKLLAGMRDAWVICTKAGETFEHGQSRFDFSAAAIRSSIEGSLRRLRTDHIEIALLHSDGDDLRLFEHDDGLSALARLRERGLVRAVGVSTKTLEGSLRTVERCDVVMLPLNMKEQACAPAVDAAHRAGKGVLVKKALASGHLGESVRDGLHSVLSLHGVSSVVVGTINAEHLRANASAVAQPFPTH